MIWSRRSDGRRTAVGAVAVAVVLVLSGCVAAPDEEVPVTQFMDSAQYVKEYQDTVASFDQVMPDGVEFPSDPPPLEGDIGVSLGTAAAYFFWSCSWEDVYLHSENGTMVSEAMSQLRMFPDTDWAQAHYDDPDGVWDRLLDDAELGDPSTLAQFYESDCVWYREQTEAS